MTTLNTGEDLPDIFYVIMNGREPWWVRHNFSLTSRMYAASIQNALISESTRAKYVNGDMDYIPFHINHNTDMHTPSSFSSRMITQYAVDLNSELYRRSHENTKIYPSRLGCVFAFGDEASAAQALEDWSMGFDMSIIKKFRTVELGVLPTRVVKVNAQIPNFLWNHQAGTIFQAEQNELLWQMYWSGGTGDGITVPDTANHGDEVTLKRDVIWEYLIDGCLEPVE